MSILLTSASGAEPSAAPPLAFACSNALRYSAALRERAPINKVRVAEVGEPVEIVVDRMVDATLVFTAEPDVERGDTVMLQECGVIRTGTQRGNAEIGALANFLTLLRGLGIGN